MDVPVRREQSLSNGHPRKRFICLKCKAAKPFVYIYTDSNRKCFLCSKHGFQGFVHLKFYLLPPQIDCAHGLSTGL